MSKDCFRTVAFLLIAIFMLIGPVYRQVMGGDNRFFRNWIMFSTIGVGIVDARFAQLMDDGSEIALDHHEILAGKYRKTRRSNIWLIQNRYGGARAVAASLCKVLGPEARIKINSRVATRIGWIRELDGEIVQCGTP